MNIKNLTRAFALSFAAVLPLSALAHPVDVTDTVIEHNDDGVLYKKAKLNKNLGEGEYDFIGLHSKLGSTYADEWKFTVADTSDVVISLTDLVQSLGSFAAWSDDFGGNHSHHGHHKSNKTSSSNYLLDNKFLTFSLFDDEDHLLGTAGEGGSISALGLAAGQWYTVTVSAKVNGIFGSAYRGSLSVAPTAVPLGGTLPMFASALVLMTIRRKRQTV
jgi:hypothetical protein